MTGPFRIHTPRRFGMAAAAEDEQAVLRGYFERLHKLIPAEVVGMYLVGAGLIPKDRAAWLVGWAIFCGIAVIVVRIWGTSDATGPQMKAVAISFMSYLIWLYTIGGPFVAFPSLEIHEPFVGSLLVIAWTFVVPYFYKGD